MSFRNPLIAPVTIAGTVTVETTGTPGAVNVQAAGALGVKTTGADTVTQTGAATTLNPPAGTPSAATRPVAASSQAQATVTGVGSTTLIASPGVAARLELHVCTIILNQSSISQVQLQRLDNNAVLWDSGSCVAGASAAATIAFPPIDFQGATLPAGVGLKLVGVAGSPVATATIVYNVLT